MKITTAFKATLSVLILLFGGPVNAETINIATSSYTPYLYKGKDGLSQELTRAAFGAVGIEVKFDNYPLIRLINYFENKKISHALFTAEPFTGDRPYTAIAIHNVLSILAYNNNHHKGLNFKELHDLSGMKVGTAAGDDYYINMFKEAGLIPIPVQMPEQNMGKLAKGRIDIAEFTYLTAIHLKASMLKDGGNNISIMENRINVVPVVLLSGKEDANTLSNTKFVEGLKIIRSNGTYQAILSKYFGDNSVPDDVLVMD